MYYIILRGYGNKNNSLIPTFYLSNDENEYKIGEIIRHKSNCKSYIVDDIVKSERYKED